METPLRILITDDEAPARATLRALLAYCPDTEIVGEAHNTQSAADAIAALAPDVVLLDIEMPGRSGLEILELIDRQSHPFEIIFTTAYSEYAIRAFQLSALDYLLKPIELTQLQTALDKARSYRAHHIRTRLELLAEHLRTNHSPQPGPAHEPSPTRIALPLAQGVVIVPLHEIIRLRADGAYTSFELTSGSHVLVSKNLKEYERILAANADFVRSHRSHIVNLRHVREFTRGDSASLVLEGGHEVPVSRERREAVFGALQQLGLR